MSKKKSKNKFVSVLMFLILCVCIYFVGAYLSDTKIKNIYVFGNNILTDQEVIEIAKLDNYPSFYKTLSSTIKKNLKTSELIKDVKVKKRFFNVLKIYVTEYKPVFIVDDKLVLENTKTIDLIPYKVPIFSGNIDIEIEKKLIEKMLLVNTEIIANISQIIYSPSEYDKERFLLYMDDGNHIYINLYKFSKLDYYNEIYPTLEGQKGTLYLDSGNHFEKFK